MTMTTRPRHSLLPRTWTRRMALLALAASSACNQTAIVGDEANPLSAGSGGAGPSGGSVGVYDAGVTGSVGGFPVSSGGAGAPTTTTSTSATSTCAPISTTPGVVNACDHTFAVAYAANGQYLVTGGDGRAPSASLWRLSDGALLFNPVGSNTETTYSAAFSPDSSLLATAGMLTNSSPQTPFVRIWDVASGKLLRTLPTHAGWYVDSVAFSHDGTLIATGGVSDNVEIWRIADGTLLRSFAVPSTAHNVHFSPDDTLLLGAIFDGTARVWNVQDGSLLQTIPTTSEMADADWSPDGKLIASTTDGNIVKLWDANSGALVQSLSGHSVYISHVVWIDKDHLLSDDWSGVVNLWTRGTSDSFALASTWSTGGQALGIAVSPDKSVFVTGAAKGTATGFAFFQLPGTVPSVGTSCAPISLVPGVLNPCGHAWAVAFSPDGQLLATGDQNPAATGNNLHLWRLSDGMPVYAIHAHAGNCYDVAFSPDGTLLATAGDSEDSTMVAPGMVKLWNAATGALVRAVPVTTTATSFAPYASSASFSHDGKLLATSGLGPIELWRVGDGTRALSIDSSGTVYQVRFSPDDALLIAAGTAGTKARVFDVKTGKLVLDNLTTASDQASADFSPDGKLIASNGDDGTNGVIHIWSATTGTLLQTMGGHSAAMGRVVWLDPTRLLSDDWNGKVILWTRNASDTFQATRTWSAGSPLNGVADSINLAISPDKTRIAVGGLVRGQGGFVFLAP